MHFDAFISYSQKDIVFARWLQKRLESYPIKRLQLAKNKFENLRIFRDETDLKSTGALSLTLRGALHDSRKLIVICSNSTPHSRWVALEIEAFLESHPVSDILPVSIDGEPFSQDPSLECVPPPLVAAVGRGHEAFVVDARSKHRRSDALLRLLAGITEQPLDAFVQRHRKNAATRRFRLVTASAGALASVAALALAAVEYDRRERLLTTAASMTGFERIRLIAEARPPKGSLLPELAQDRISTLINDPRTRALTAAPLSYLGTRLARRTPDNSTIFVPSIAPSYLDYRGTASETPFTFRVVDPYRAASAEELPLHVAANGESYSFTRFAVTNKSALLVFRLGTNSTRTEVDDYYVDRDGKPIKHLIEEFHPRQCVYIVVDKNAGIWRIEKMLSEEQFTGSYCENGLYIGADSKTLYEFPLKESGARNRIDYLHDRAIDRSKINVLYANGVQSKQFVAKDFGFDEFRLAHGSSRALLVDLDAGKIGEFDLTYSRISSPIIDVEPCAQHSHPCEIKFLGGDLFTWNSSAGESSAVMFHIPSGKRVSGLNQEVELGEILERNFVLERVGNGMGAKRIGQIAPDGSVSWAPYSLPYNMYSREDGVLYLEDSEISLNQISGALEVRPELLFVDASAALTEWCRYDLLGVQALALQGDINNIERPCRRRGVLSWFGVSED